MEGLAAFVTKSFNADSKVNSETECGSETNEDVSREPPDEPTDLSIKSKDEPEPEVLQEEVTTKTEYIEPKDYSDNGESMNI